MTFFPETVKSKGRSVNTASIRLNILSDLHLGYAGLPLPENDADIVILAGDISRPAQAISWAAGIDKPVLYVAGNHEFYGSGMGRTTAQLRNHAAGTRIRILDNEAVVLSGVRFLGTTLWSDFNLDGAGMARKDAITQALKLVRDFHRIESDTQPGSKLTPGEMEALFVRNRAWLRDRLDEPFDGPTVVVTHHAPSMKSIHPRFALSPINTCFVSNSEYLMDRSRVDLWIHGHTHDSFDYYVNGTRVVCNSRGYVLNGVIENAAFDPDLVVEVPLSRDTGRKA